MLRRPVQRRLASALALGASALAFTAVSLDSSPAGAAETNSTPGETVVFAVGDGADGTPTSAALATYIKAQSPDRFFYLGDVYETGTATEFANNYEPLYGSMASVTDPVIGNHESANRSTGYYPYWRGKRGWTDEQAKHRSYVDAASGWQIIAYSSEETSMAAEAAWVAGEVAKHEGTCRIVMAHKGRHVVVDTSHNDNLEQEPVWAAIVDKTALNLVGHNHIYGRLAPISGVTVIVSGAGGHNLRSLGIQHHTVAASKTGIATATKLVLRRGAADFSQVDKDGTVHDSGTITCTPAPEPPAADFDGDADTDFSVWRPEDGSWYPFGSPAEQWGVSSDVPVPGQYDGDPATDVAVWRPDEGMWFVKGGATQQWGVSTDVPVPCDYDGDRDTDFAVWRPETGTWYVFGGATQEWGVATDIPVPADYDGDGDCDIAVWRPETGTWYVFGAASQQWGVASDIPVPGDFDGDGDTDFAVWRPESGTWYSHGGATQQWGISTDVPVPGDYDGDGDTEFAVWRPSGGVWYVLGGPTQQWGVASDKPLPLAPAIARLLYP